MRTSLERLATSIVEGQQAHATGYGYADTKLGGKGGRRKVRPYLKKTRSKFERRQGKRRARDER